MTNTVIAFAARTARAANENRRLHRPAAGHDNVISLAGWINRAMPRRTPTGVYFTTRVLMTTGETA